MIQLISNTNALHIYAPDDEYTLLWNDKKIGIDWPMKNPVLSEKDSKGLSLDEVMKIIK